MPSGTGGLRRFAGPEPMWGHPQWIPAAHIFRPVTSTRVPGYPASISTGRLNNPTSCDVLSAACLHRDETGQTEASRTHPPILPHEYCCCVISRRSIAKWKSQYALVPSLPAVPLTPFEMRRGAATLQPMY